MKFTTRTVCERKKRKSSVAFLFWGWMVVRIFTFLAPPQSPWGTQLNQAVIKISHHIMLKYEGALMMNMRLLRST